MTKIIIKNAPSCSSPILISVKQKTSVGGDFPIGTPILEFIWDQTTIPSDVDFLQITIRDNLASSPTPLITLNVSQQSPYIYGTQPLPALGKWYSIATNSPVCGLDISALVQSTT